MPTHPGPAAARMARNSSAFSEAPPINPPSTSGMREQFRRIAGLDAAAVEDTRGGGNFSIPRRQPRPDEGVHVLGLLGGRGAAGADRPAPAHRPPPPAEGARAAAVQDRVQLPGDHLLRCARLRARPAARPRTGSASACGRARPRTCGRPAGRSRRTAGAARSGRRSRSSQPRSFSIPADTSPVKAPCASAQTSWAPRLSAESRSRRATSCRYTNGGQTTHCGRWPRRAPASSSMSRAFSAREPCIFQLPATKGWRMQSRLLGGKPPVVKGARCIAAPATRRSALNDPPYRACTGLRATAARHRRRPVPRRRPWSRLVPALHHHPDDRLGARGPQHHAPLARQARLDARTAGLHCGTRGRVEALGHLHVQQHLGKLAAPRRPVPPASAPVCFMTASTCSALTRPSPVVVLSRHRMCPEVSPPRIPPVSRSIAST